MKTYKCDICEKIFKQKSHYDNHKKRKNPCIKRVSVVVSQNIAKKVQDDCNSEKKGSTVVSTKQKKVYDCKYCKKQFSFKNNLYRHLQTCQVKQQIHDEKENIFNRLLAEMEELKKSNNEIKTVNKKLMHRINKLERKNAQISINNNINNGQITYNNNNIKLVAFGKEDRKNIDKKDVLRAINGFGTEIALTNLIHFNDKFPENHNVYINNRKDNYAMTFDGEQWILKSKTDVVEGIYDANRDYVEENLEEFVESLDESRIDSLHRWLDTDEHDDKIKKIKNEIKMLLYNKKYIVIKQLAKPDISTITEV